MKKLYVEIADSAVKVALTEGDTLRELIVSHGSWVDKIIMGKIKTILPNEMAFIDIGHNKNALMNTKPGHGLKAGDSILVQVQKDPAGKKGAYVSQAIKLKGSLAILYEHAKEAGISRKITDQTEAKRLKNIALQNLPPGYGILIRTGAQHKTEAEISAEIQTLHQLHQQIKASKATAPTTIHPAEEEKIPTDFLTDDISEIHVSGNTEGIPFHNGAQVFRHEKGLFKKLNSQISAALDKTNPLPCGGNVTFEETEACVVIDVNTASNISAKYREAVLQTNLEAAAHITRQITLRNLSGIIIIDFIDMPADSDKAMLMETLTAECKKERIPPEVIGMIPQGMVQLIRRKTRPSLSQAMLADCQHCGGTGKRQRL
ncbi:MAG: ribonuclease E/G [Defluviitaleaceae bacterium]|nr:ribonuclease E/G [Defluviitaleaceae bacterium]